MKLKKVLALMGCVCLLISGCGNSEDKEPVEITNTEYGSYYTDEVVYSSRKTNNYLGYFLSEDINLDVALDLNSLDSLVYGWEWEILDESYTGSEVVIPEEDLEAFQAATDARMEELEKERAKAEEEAKKAAKSENTTESESGGTVDSVDSSSEVVEEISIEDVEEEINPTHGNATKLSEIVAVERDLYPGQVLRITPVFVYSEPEESEELKEGTDSSEETIPTPTDTGVSEENNAEPTEELEEIPEPKAELISHIDIINYLSAESLSISDCVNNMWYSVSLSSYSEVFDLSSEDGEEFSDDTELFTAIANILGNPTIAWESPIDADDYVEGNRVEVVAFEFPEYTFEANIVEDGTGNISIEGIKYIPSQLWLKGNDFVGLRMLHTQNDIEITHETVPTVEPTLETTED